MFVFLQVVPKHDFWCGKGVSVCCPFAGFVVLSVHIDVGVERFLFDFLVWDLLLLAFLYFLYVPFL